jgi:hypothetical protein
MTEVGYNDMMTSDLFSLELRSSIKFEGLYYYMRDLGTCPLQRMMPSR